jgi:hypothetical protein
MVNSNRASLRHIIQSSLAHRVGGNALIDSLADLSDKFNGLIDRLNDTILEEIPAVKEELIVVCEPDVAGSLNGTYFLLSSTTEDFYVWFKVNQNDNDDEDDDDQGDNNPLISERTGIKVVINVNESAENVATKVASALNGAVFSADSVNNTVYIQVNNAGPVLNPPSAGTSGFDVIVSNNGAPASMGFPQNFAAVNALTVPNIDDFLPGGPSRTTLRELMRRTLATYKNADLAVDQILNAIVQLQSNYSALLAKLDAQAGTLTSTDFVSQLSVGVLDPDAPIMGSSIRQIFSVALAAKNAADKILDLIVSLQTNFNAALAMLDNGTFTQVMKQFKVASIDWDNSD